MKYKSLLTLLLLSWKCNIQASENYIVGARFKAMADASVSLSDPWCTFHNQAGLAMLQKISAAFYHESKFLLSQLDTHALTMAIPLNISLLDSFFG